MGDAIDDNTDDGLKTNREVDEMLREYAARKFQKEQFFRIEELPPTTDTNLGTLLCDNRAVGRKPSRPDLPVDGKQIPHLRVMSRNIRLLKSDLEPFRSRFKQEVEDGTTT